jgi:hypothetical protein
MPTPVTQMDRIRGIQFGDVLEAQETLHMEATNEQVFTRGQFYTVIRVEPNRNPPSIVVLDDSGVENSIEPNFLHNFSVLR